MEQQRKPGAGPSKDISDLKARLGLKRPEAAPRPVPVPGPAPSPGGSPFGGAAPMPPGVAPPGYQQQSAAPAAPPASLDPYAGMKPQQGMFDLRSIDDGVAVENVRGKTSKAALIGMIATGVVAFALGGGLGISSVGRANQNSANRAAKMIKAEVDGMQKKLTVITKAVLDSKARMAKNGKDVLSYDPDLISDLEKVSVDIRPSTEKIFRADYYRLPDVVVDQLFNYYYDTNALFGEIERHIKRTKADQPNLAAFAAKVGDAKKQVIYGVIFQQEGKLSVGNLVEVGEQKCKGNAKPPCSAADLEGFKVRLNTGSTWFDRKVSGKDDGDRVVVLKPTELMDKVMSGSSDQVINETYRQRTANIIQTVGRISNTQKELVEGINKAANRPDLFSIF